MEFDQFALKFWQKNFRYLVTTIIMIVVEHVVLMNDTGPNHGPRAHKQLLLDAAEIRMINVLSALVSMFAQQSEAPGHQLHNRGIRPRSVSTSVTNTTTTHRITTTTHSIAIAIVA